jgi:hypothetical protein
VTNHYNLTVQQKNFFATFGFLHLPGYFADCADDLTRAFTEVWNSYGGGHAGRPHDEQRRSVLVRFIDQHDYLRRLLDDPRIERTAASLVGDDFNYMGSDGNYYVGDSRWHSDDWDSAIQHIKFLFYLDPLSKDTGALRVLPGSHRIGDVYADTLHKLSTVDGGFRTTERTDGLLGVPSRDLPAYAIETQPGDLIVLDHNCKHASFGGGLRRRMFSLLCCQRYPEHRLPQLREYLATYARFWIGRAYDEQMVNTAGPGRRRHLEQVLANDGHLTELARLSMAETTEPSRD